MDPALGPPESMAENEELTPMIAQYVEACERYDDCLVLFHVGDFYKTFGEAAETVARLCELTLVTREDSTGEYAMAGIPIDSAESYVETLLSEGYRVAVAEQVEDPEEVAGVADRQVTRVITPGTLTEDELLGGAEHNFVACLARGDGYGLALLDVSTGDLYVTGADREAAIRDEVGRFSPAEAIVGPGVEGGTFDPGCMVTPYDERAFDLDRARERVADYFGADAGLAAEAEVRACGALLAYAEYTRGAGERLEYITYLTRYDPREYMLLSSVAVESLELFERRSVHGEGEALIDVLDETASALGSRELRDWLRRPLLDRDAIGARLDAVEELVGAVRARESVHGLLREVYDLERLISRVSRGRADARDLRSLAATLAVVPEIEAELAGLGAGRLGELRRELDGLEGIRGLVDDAIVPDPPVEITEGDVIAAGYSEELDALRETEREGKEWIEALEERERERTGIDSLEVGYNSVHGYYIEVTDANLDRVPDDYTRRQTLKNAERYYTPELKAREDEILRAEQRADDLEYELFCEVRDRVAEETERVQALAGALAEVDALAALAEVAASHDYARPEIGGDGIRVREGRHPVVERAEDRFVPNDARLGGDERVAVVTGPNMSGKSTYMRGVALIQILAQIGSFVPAAGARVGLVDRVFTRIGASDDIAGGRSTFMIEMTELAEILREATADSLVLLDEVGRGTSTADGLAIARAITEHLHDEVGATTLFATHHHELTETAEALPGAVNLHFDVAEIRSPDGEGREVVFDHEIAPGAAAASYGIEVARMAGVPEPVVRRSRELVDGGEPDPDGVATNGGAPPGDGDDDLTAAIRGIDVAETTPLEALNVLADLKRRVEDGGRGS